MKEILPSINLLPFSLFQKLKLRELKPTSMSLHLVDGLVKYLRGMVENVLIKVDKYCFPTNFIILDIEADQEIPLVFG